MRLLPTVAVRCLPIMIEARKGQTIFPDKVIFYGLMREVHEGDAVYSLGESRVEEKETLARELKVGPKGGSMPMEAVFEQEFFVQ